MLLFAGAILITYALGIFRDFVFTNINKQIAIRSLTSSSGSGLSVPQMVQQKWVLTLAFSIAYLCISLGVIHLIYREKKYTFLTGVAYCAIFVTSLTIAFLGYFFGKPGELYRLSRDIMGLVQSPFLLMLLIPSFLLIRKNYGATK